MDVDFFHPIIDPFPTSSNFNNNNPNVDSVSSLDYYPSTATYMPQPQPESTLDVLNSPLSKRQETIFLKKFHQVLTSDDSVQLIYEVSYSNYFAPFWNRDSEEKYTLKSSTVTIQGLHSKPKVYHFTNQHFLSFTSIDS